MSQAEDISDALSKLAIDAKDAPAAGKTKKPRNRKKQQSGAKKSLGAFAGPDDDGEKACEKPWSQLTSQQQQLAAALNFDRTSWGDDAIGDEDGCEEDWSNVPWTWAQLEGERLSAAQALGFVADSWKGGPAKPRPNSGRSNRRRAKKKPAALAGANAVAAPAISLSADPPPKSSQPQYLYPRKAWGDLPDWIVLSDERGKSRPFPPLHEDPLFSIAGGPQLLPHLPPPGTPGGRGAAVVCPGGNLEFLHPREGAPVARWLAETFGIPAYVLRYRLLPCHGLDEILADFENAVRVARANANGGPVVAFGFSAGGYVCASGSAACGGAPSNAGASASGSTSGSAFGEGDGPDALGLIYPCTLPDGWLLDDECGFQTAECDSPQVQSLVKGRERLRAGAAFVKPPPCFVVASTADEVCPPEHDTDPYVAAAREAGVAVEYLLDDYGDHGFGLKRFWAAPCEMWLRNLGLGEPAAVTPVEGGEAPEGALKQALQSPDVKRELSCET